MTYAPYDLSVDHLPTDLQRTATATVRYAQLQAAKQQGRRSERRSALPGRRAARA